MKNVSFVKYQGAGNDFIFINAYNHPVLLSASEIEFLCDRHFGIGADGLIILTRDDEADFFMHYYNSDGQESTMCGNGGRCAVHFAQTEGIIGKSTRFKAVDGWHDGQCFDANQVEISMIDVDSLQHHTQGTFVNTGSPHLIIESVDVSSEDVLGMGRKNRLDESIHPGGCNVNFVQTLADGVLKIRTYERGVEDETLACGTGVTAAALASLKGKPAGDYTIALQAKGGNLQVSCHFQPALHPIFTHIRLHGPAQPVFKGLIQLR